MDNFLVLSENEINLRKQINSKNIEQIKSYAMHSLHQEEMEDKRRKIKLLNVTTSMHNQPQAPCIGRIFSKLPFQNYLFKTAFLKLPTLNLCMIWHLSDIVTIY